MMEMTGSAFAVDRRTVLQGQALIGSGRPEILTTVLGSCIACCLFDPIERVGGMNHFLLAEPDSISSRDNDLSYGLFLMELLINKLMAKGALKSRMKAHIYGGANMHAGMARIGDANTRFATSFLAAESIELVRSNTGGDCARRVEFDPVQGRARCRIVEQVEAPAPRPVARRTESVGDVELF